MKRDKIEKIIDAEKIAAGEVIERPANVVKELIENSIDASAKEIRIIIKKAGKSLIQIIDDGVGIPRDEIEIAFERFTSSKIRRFDDLEHLSTLGFRGEALASIAAVSQIEIISKTEEETLGTQLFIEGGRIIDKKEISCSVGTNIKVKNLFFNIPARLKFLKSESTELAHTTDIIERYVLAYPNVHFIYRHNDFEILNCPGLNDLKTTVFHVYGKKMAKFIEQFDYSDAEFTFKIYGLLGHPQLAKKNRNLSSIFLNHRYIISDLLYDAIKEAYSGVLMVNKYPFFIVFLDLDPSIIDFNVHPKKLHVRFENESIVYNKVYKAIRSCVEEKFVIEESKYLSAEINDFILKKEKEIPSEIENGTNHENDIETEVKEIKNEEIIKSKHEIHDQTVQLSLKDDINIEKLDQKEAPESYIRNKYIITKNFPKLKLISYTGQLSNKYYIILEGINEDDELGFYILDQHAASERINKERLLNDYESTKVNKQILILPLKIEVNSSQKFFLENNFEHIKKLGFDFEYFGGNTFILRAVPTIIEKVPELNIIEDMINDLTQISKEKSFSDVKEEIFNYLACHKSIRGGDNLTLKEIRNLIIDLSNCKDPYHCAHGRPTLKFISFKELDKLFGRKL